jgi:hypothetical protein
MACSVVENGTWSGGRAECRNGGSRVAVECSDDDVAECRDEGCSAGEMVEPMMPVAGRSEGSEPTALAVGFGRNGALM